MRKYLVRSILDASYVLFGYFWLYLHLIFLSLKAVLTPLQGFLNTLVYGWTRKSFRLASRSRGDINNRIMPTQPEMISSEIMTDDSRQPPTIFESRTSE